MLRQRRHTQAADIVVGRGNAEPVLPRDSVRRRHEAGDVILRAGHARADAPTEIRRPKDL
jgi:hypothetical protein